MAAAKEELTSSVTEISRQAQHAWLAACDAVDLAQSASSLVLLLNASKEKIGDVVTLIANIAGQTDLLALNATTIP